MDEQGTLETSFLLSTESRQVAPHARVLQHLPPDDPSPMFADDVWDFGPNIKRKNLKKSLTQLKWDGVPSHWRLTAREYIYGRLNELEPKTRGRMSPATAAGELHRLRNFLAFCDDIGRPLMDLTQEDLDVHLNRLIAKGASQGVIWQSVNLIQHLARLRNRFTEPGMQVVPWGGFNPAKEQRTAENKTPRIPENVMAPMLRLALFYVRTASRDIFAARTEIERLKASLRPWPSATGQLQNWIEQRERQGRGLPALSIRASLRHGDGCPGVNARQCLLMAGIRSTRPTPRMAELLTEASVRMPLESGGLDTEVSMDPTTGLPWRERFNRESIPSELRMLHAACYIVIAYLSGMRDSEVQMLQRGCIEREKDHDGNIIRYRIHGRVYKDRFKSGRPARWVVLKEVAEAIDVLERVGDGELLFEPQYYKQQASVVGPRITAMLNDFRDRIGILRPADPVPEVNGQPWHFISRQFRRTVAWHIANQPFGEVAGMIQYQHVKMSTFQGYAGTSESGFRAEVEQEEAERRMRDVFDLYEDYKRGVRATSVGAERLHRQFQDVMDSTDDFPGRIVDERRRRSMISAIAVDYYAGVFNDCLLQVETAACLKGAPAGRRPLPVLGMCSPAKCPNSAVLPKHGPAWAAYRDGVEHRLADPQLGNLKRSILEGQLADAQAVLGGIPNE